MKDALASSHVAFHARCSGRDPVLNEERAGHGRDSSGHLILSRTLAADESQRARRPRKGAVHAAPTPSSIRLSFWPARQPFSQWLWCLLVGRSGCRRLREGFVPTAE
ncbi:hypothetical protein MTO96_037285 [Rhipicephalus appendiculatus]